MRFSYSGIWDDMVRLLKAQGSLLVAVAGVFLLLPELLTAYFLPRPEPKSMADLVQLYSAYVGANWLPLVLAMLVTAIGAIAILLLLLDRRQPTVGAAIGAAVPLLIPYVVATFLSNMMIAGGLSLLIVPGLYLIGRTAPLGPALVAEGWRNPIAAIGRSFDVTRGNGWMVAGLVMMIFAAGYLLLFAVSRVVGAIFLLAAGPRLGLLLVLILQSALAAAFTVVSLVLYAAIYRRLTAAA